MRPDMGKVLVERPRPGSSRRGDPVHGYGKRVRRMMDRDGGTPVREGMKRPYRDRTKPFNENLAPLRRFLLSRVGRPWDKVHAELCERIDRGNVVQKHVLTHLSDFVLSHLLLIDGQPCWGDSEYQNVRWGRYGRPLRELDLRQVCYVCPKSGLLKRVPPRRKPQPTGKPPPPAYVRVDDRRQCRLIEGRWELVTLARLPVVVGWTAHPYDVVLGRSVDEAEARATYGAPVYAVERRVLAKKDLKRYPIPIDFIR